MSETTEAVTEAPVAELPGDGLRESIVDDLRRHIGDALVEHLLKPQDDLWIRVRVDAWAATGRALSEMGFTYFCFLSALDWKPSPFGRGEDDPTQPPPERKTEIEQGYAGGETRFQVFARVTDTRRHVGVTVKADVPDEPLAVDSWHAIYAGANWHERETHEMFGIDFVGHPDLRNMYLPGEFEGFPLRKDFPLLSRIVKPWPGIVDVEPMPEEEEEEVPEGTDVPAPADAEVAGAEDDVAAHPETAAEPTDVTEETVVDAPEHAAVDAAEAPDAVTSDDDATEFVSAEVPESGQIADANEAEPEAPAPADAPFDGAVLAPEDGSMPPGYEIKGNAQSMLFHVPGSRYYKATKAEYWFDTEDHARAAGFRKPGESDEGAS